MLVSINSKLFSPIEEHQYPRGAARTLSHMTSSSVAVPRGKPKSGRVWRTPGKRSKSVIAVPALKSSWKKREVDRAEQKAVKEYERELKEAARREKEEKRKKTEEKKQRKLENERKGEVIQKITNSSKLKRLKKKQLRQIEKR